MSGSGRFLASFGAALAALLAGAAMPLGFAPVHLYGLLPIAIALLFWLWRDCSPRMALLLGWLFGLGMFGVGTSWIYVSIHDMGQLSVWLAGLITFVFVAVLALFPALLGWLVNRFAPRAGVLRSLLVLPAGWVLMEWLRSTAFTGFPWLLLGYSQVDGALAVMLPVTGTLGASWLIALSAGMLCLMLAQRWPGRVLLAVMVVLVWSVVALLPQTAWTVVDGKPLSFSLLQEGTPQQLRWQREQRLLSVNRYLDLMRDEWGRDLLVWPENALPLFHHQIGPLREMLNQQASKHKSTVLIGMPYMERPGRRYFNSAVMFPEPAGRYDKHHLVPFTEYLPFQSQLQWLLDAFQVPMSDFSAGDTNQPLLRINGRVIGVSICYESAYPEDVFRALPEAGLLINLSNDGWFGDTLGPHQHLQIAQVRAAESGRWMLRATNTGITALIDPMGRVVSQAPRSQPAVLRGKVQPMTGATPYVSYRDTPVLVLMLLLFGLGVLLSRRNS